MIEGLKPYAGYKESGLPWAPQIPAHWSLIPNRAVLRKRKVLVGGNYKNYQLLSLTKSGVIVRDISSGKGKFSSDMGTSQEVRKGDLVFCLFDVPETPRTVGLSIHDGMITSAYTVFESRKLPMEGVRYFERFYLAMDDQKLLSPLYSGLRHTIPPPRFLGTKTPQPPADEQAAIVRFLDHANRKIDGFIRAKRKLIGLLNEQKQAIIHRAVTRGLHPDVPLKPSGIPWLGDIPAHWQTITVGAVTSLIQTGPFGSQLHSHEYVRGGIPIVNPSHMLDGRIFPDADVAVSESKSKELARHRLAIGDIVVARRGELGRCALVTSQEVGWLCGTGSLLLRCKGDVFNPGYFQEVFSSRGVCDLLRLSSVGATMDNLNAGIVARLRFPLPTAEEQAKILQFINRERIKNEAAHSITEREIALMQEYRTRLAADIVTGKLDVREAAARLPATSDLSDLSDLSDYDHRDL